MSRFTRWCLEQRQLRSGRVGCLDGAQHASPYVKPAQAAGQARVAALLKTKSSGINPLLHKARGHREMDAETSPAPVVRGTLAIQATFGFGNAAGDDGQTQAGALGFGREKRL
jgi:hypothetical protein